MIPSRIPAVSRLGDVLSNQLRHTLAHSVDALTRRVDAFAGTKTTEAAAINTELQAAFDEAKAFITGRYAIPTVTALNDVAGVAAGGETITLTGTNFLSVHSVKFGTTEATSFQIVSSTSIKAVVPAHAAGAVNVLAVNSVGSAAAVAGNVYTYS
jgi:hypothetical protein